MDLLEQPQEPRELDGPLVVEAPSVLGGVAREKAPQERRLEGEGFLEFFLTFSKEERVEFFFFG